MCYMNSLTYLLTSQVMLLCAGFLTDDLVSVENNGEQKKYLGVCRLPHADAKVHRQTGDFD